MPGNILQRLNAVQQKIDYIQKEKKTGMKYSIVSHDAVTAKVRPAMVDEGILYYPLKFQMTQNGNRTQAHCTIRFVSIDDPADFIDVETGGYGVDDQDKGPGKAMSYGVKYALLKVLGLESGDDPDLDQGDGAAHVSDVRKVLEGLIDGALTEDALTHAGQDINKDLQAGNLTPAEASLLRQRYAKKLRTLKEPAQ